MTPNHPGAPRIPFDIARAAGQLERDMEKRKRKQYDLSHLQAKSDLCEPVKVPQYERD